MIRRHMIMSAAAATLALASCSGSDDPDPTPTPSPTATPTPTPTASPTYTAFPLAAAAEFGTINASISYTGDPAGAVTLGAAATDATANRVRLATSNVIATATYVINEAGEESRFVNANVTVAPNTRQRQNVDAVRAKGLEFAAALKLGTVSFDGSLALTDAEVQASGAQAPLDGLRPAQTPRIAASASLSWRPRPGWTLSTTLRHVGAQFEDDLQADALRAATTLDAYLEVPVTGPFSLVLRGENLTDTDIVTRNQAGSIDLGVPRTLWAGVKVRVK